MATTKTTTTRTRTTTAAATTPSTEEVFKQHEEVFKQHVVDIDKEIKRLDTSIANAHKTITDNTDKRNALVRERLEIPSKYYPADSTAPTPSKVRKPQGLRTPLREKHFFTVVDGIRERGTASVGAAVFGVIFGIILGIIAAFIFSWLVTNWLTVLIPILWLIQLALVMAGMAFGYQRATRPKDLVSPIH